MLGNWFSHPKLILVLRGAIEPIHTYAWQDQDTEVERYWLPFISFVMGNVIRHTFMKDA